MRRWVTAGFLAVLVVMFQAAPARATTIGLFDWTTDPLGGPAFELLNTSTLADALGNLFPELTTPQVVLNGDPALTYDLFNNAGCVGSPSCDPAGNPQIVSPSFSANTVDDLSAIVITSAQVIFGAAPPGLLTINYFNVTDAGDVIAATSLARQGDFATIDYQPVPEPATLTLLLAGIGTLGAARRRASLRERRRA